MSLKNITTEFEHIKTIDLHMAHKRAEIYKASFDDIYMIEYYRVQDQGTQITSTLGDIEIMSKEKYIAFMMLQE